jgi:hypothetical protein
MKDETKALIEYWREATLLNVSGWLVREDGGRIRVSEFIAEVLGSQERNDG